MKYFLFLYLLLQPAKLTVQRTADGTDVGLEKRGASVKDLLSHTSCRYIKKNGYCNHTFIQNKLCYTTCQCDDLISKLSCGIVKAKNKCQISWSAYFCPFTCDRCNTSLCNGSNPLGMKSKAIPDSSITASSSYGQGYYPGRARLDSKNEGSKKGGWAARTNNVREWLQVDLGQATKVTHIATQGRRDSTEWVKSYSIQYSFDGQRFIDYQAGKIFAGNSNHNTIVKHAITPAIIARYIRVRPKTWNGWIAMRMELYGCK